jgi:riboflavin kinase / FMN adenylyltransferase
MHVIRNFAGEVFDELSAGSIVTIGNFDGLHRGHQKLLDEVREQADISGLPTVVMCFEPTPQEFFAPQNPPARLMRFDEKRRALEEYGMDVFCCLDFDASMRSGSPQWFVEEILVAALHVQHLIVGDQFRFGKNRSGDVADLQKAGEKHDFQVRGIACLNDDGTPVSSTLIRRALSAGNLPRAAELLGRNYRMSGTVIHGNHLGRRLGFPTANIDPDRIQVALMGIFAVRVWGLGGDALEGVASIGTRPTVGGTKMLLEVYIFDFDADIYGQEIEIEFVEKIRDELNFPDIDALIEYINKDVAAARKILAARQTEAY